MRLNDLEDLDSARIRGLQAIYGTAHRSLSNWGSWAMDLGGIFPSLKPPAIWSEFNRGRCDPEGWGEEKDYDAHCRILIKLPPAEKADPIEKAPYDEKQALILDERIHGPGGPDKEVRLCIKTAYTTRAVPENQFWKLSGCSTPDIFCERLEAALRYVGRFA